jgi:glucose/arabinose dehydrogenase
MIAAVAVALSGCVSSGSGSNSTSASGEALVAIGAGLHGPSGTTASVFASGLKNVSAFAFDADGQLWAATASYDDTGSDHVYLVTKPGATPVEVLSGLHTPLGLLWYHDALYVASKGRVDAYRGFNRTKFASHTTVLTLPDGVGDSNQVVLTPDGHMLMGVSAACDHCVPDTEYSAAIVSFLPDGSDLRIYAKRVRAGIGLTYYPGTTDLFVTMNQRDDLGDATPGDWLAVVHDGDDWGFPACYGQSGASACRAVPEPTAVLDQHSAVSGVAIVTGQLGVSVGTAAVVAEWSDGKVQRVALTKSGAQYTGTVHPFLTGLKNPMPVTLSPEGALIVGDWATGLVYAISAT